MFTKPGSKYSVPELIDIVRGMSCNAIEFPLRPGTDGQCSWPRAAACLKKKGYEGTWCMPAEYTRLTPEQEAEYARRDLTWLKSLAEGK